MTDSSITRRGLLAVGLLGPTVSLLGAPEASASTKWRLLPEQLTILTKPLGPPTSPTYMGGFTPGPDHIPLWTLPDGRKVIHPTQLGNLGLGHLESHMQDGDPGHLRFMAPIVEALMQRAVRRQGARFLAYEFDWLEHTDPWFSAFGQAKFPRTLHWLAAHTGERKWSAYLQEVMQAFFLPPVRSKPTEPWIAGADSNNCLWLEEAPEANASFSAIFNGHFYALNELGDYMAASGDPRARDLIQGAAFTLDFYRNLCRVPGSCSSYDAKSVHQLVHYHKINASCYTSLFNLTGLPRIGTFVDQLAHDWPVTGGPGTLRVEKVPVQIVKHTQAGPGTPQQWTPPQPLDVRSSTRTRWVGFPGVWSYMNAGPRAGWFARETPGTAYRVGVETDALTFRRNRSVIFRAGVPIHGYRVDAAGYRSLARTTTLSRPSMAHSTHRANIAGSHHIRIDDGSFAGLWVPEGQEASYR